MSGPLQFLALIYGLLAVVLAGFMLLERSRLGAAFRMIGEDPTLAALNGIAVLRAKLLAAALAGALAGLGGGLYAHLTTYLEPRIFDVMLGVHSPCLWPDRRARHRARAADRRADRHRDAGIHPGVRRLPDDHLRRARRGAADRAAARAARRAAGAPHRPGLFGLFGRPRPDKNGAERKPA
jgi:hypothetical protein